MGILRTIKYETIASSPDYFDDKNLEVADYYVITDTGKAFAIWNLSNEWYAAAIECTLEGAQSSNIWRRLSGASISAMESDFFKSKKELMDAISNDTISLMDKSKQKSAIHNSINANRVNISKGDPTATNSESSGCLALIVAIGLSTATVLGLTIFLSPGN